MSERIFPGLADQALLSRCKRHRIYIVIEKSGYADNMKRHGDGKKFTSLRRSCGLNVGYPIFFFPLTSDIPYCIIVI